MHPSASHHATRSPESCAARGVAVLASSPALCMVSASAVAASAGGKHTDAQGRTLVIVGQTTNRWQPSFDHWYPGADVDWTGITLFNPENCANGYGTALAVVGYLKTKNKPLLVADIAARGCACAEGHWGNTRLDVNPGIRAKWLKELTPDGKHLRGEQPP
jgi:hypothetical protein